MEQQKFNTESAGPRIREFLDLVRSSSGFDFDYIIGPAARIHEDFENPEVVVSFSGPDVELLLANKGELLLALEHLTMEFLRMKPVEHSLLQFDANDYRLLRIEELRMSALTAAERVKKSKLPFEFSPMTSRERRIIHLSLRNDPAIRSESSGSGPFRQVIVYPAGMPSLPAKPQPPMGARRPGGPGGRGRR